MPREPLYPHIPGRKEPLFPHLSKGQRVERLPQTREGIKNFWVEQNPEGTWAVVEAFPGGTIRSPFKTKEEAIKREYDFGQYNEWNLKQVPSPQEKFPKQHEALKGLYPYIIVEYHDDGDLTLRELISRAKGRGFELGKLYVLTTDGQVFEETQLAMMTLPKTEGDPLRKFCCRQCGECAPTELLEEGRFPDRIAWLRHHYKEKHPSMWGKSYPEVKYKPSLLREQVTPITPEVAYPRIPEARLRELRHREEIVLQAIRDKPGITFPELEQVTKLEPVQIDGAIRRLGGKTIIKTEAQMTPGGLKPSSYRLTPEVAGSPEKLPQVTIEGGEPISPEYQHLTGWVSEPLPKEAE